MAAAISRPTFVSVRRVRRVGCSVPISSPDSSSRLSSLSSFRMSSALCTRFDTSFERQRRTILESSRGIPERPSEIDGGTSLMMEEITSEGVVPSNGGRPVNIRQNTIPSEKMSERASTVLRAPALATCTCTSRQ